MGNRLTSPIRQFYNQDKFIFPDTACNTGNFGYYDTHSDKLLYNYLTIRYL